ncbi:universal stress protein [Variovorax sp. dw_954]|uniref:universal stress protein n=1 Tax=Variovorax sp. dw_954 TaxID=2720078 RepID=UPI001BD42E81|nr:universal stress protein [Variovorax sp. dw_954]
MFKRILVATDGSPLSEQAVGKAIELSLLCGADLCAVTVAHLEPHSYFEGSPVLSQMQVEEMRHRSVSAAHGLVDAVKASALNKGVRNVESAVVPSNQVAESIIETATTHNCDLIVMASHGRRTLKRLLMGSETLHVLTHSNTPVLVLR